MLLLTKALISVFVMTAACSKASVTEGSKNISHTNSLIHYHGRWDSTQSTWWAGSGFKIHVKGLSKLVINLGPLTSSPNVAVGLSINYANFTNFNLTAGANEITLPNSQKFESSTILRFNVEGWQNNRLQLESLVINQVKDNNFSQQPRTN